MKRILSSFFILTLITTSVMADEKSTAQMQEEIDFLKERVAELEKKLEESPQQQRYRRHDPFSQMDALRQRMHSLMHDDFFGGPGGSFFGEDDLFNLEDQIDMVEEPDEYVLKVETAGLAKDQLDVEVHANSISINGERREQVKQENDHGEFHSQSIGSFYKTIPLPVDADTAKLEIDEQEDQLVIRIPKKK